MQDTDTKKSLTNSHPPTAMDISSYLRYTADEVFEITKRKQNLVTSGLPEADQDIQDFFILPTCITTYRHLSQLMTSTTQKDWIIQALRRDHGYCVFKFICWRLDASCWKCGKIPKDKYGFRTPSIHVRPDLTKSQLQTDKLLCQQLLIAGKDRYIIYVTVDR